MVGEIPPRPFPSPCPRRAGRLRRAALVAALILACGIQTAGAGSGYWIITGYVLGPASALDQAAAEAYKGKRVLLDDESIQFDSKTCAITPSLAEHEATSYFGDNFRIDPRLLGHGGDKVFVIETGCDIPGLSSLVLLDDGRMCFFLDGVFFFLNEELE